MFFNWQSCTQMSYATKNICCKLGILPVYTFIIDNIAVQKLIYELCWRGWILLERPSKNTYPEFANIILELQCHSLEIVVGIGRAGLMVKAFMPCIVYLMDTCREIVLFVLISVSLSLNRKSSFSKASIKNSNVWKYVFRATV